MKSIYLDSAVLWEAHDLLSLKDDKSLADLILKICEKGNLCLSFIHLFELLDDEIEERILSRAKWLSQLNPIWLYSDVLVIEPKEIRKLALKKVYNIDVELNPFAPSFLRLLTDEQNPSPREIQEMIELGGDLVAYAKQCSKFRKQLVDPLIQSNMSGLMKFGLTPKAKGQSKKEIDLNTRLSRRKALDSQIIKKAKLEVFRIHETITPHEAQRLQNNYLSQGFAPDSSKLNYLDKEDLKECPYLYLRNEAIVSLSMKIPGALSAKQIKAKYRTEIFDLSHLVGAAYCDVFNCDSRTFSNIQLACKDLGLLQPFAVKQNAINFYELLTNVLLLL